MLLGLLVFSLMAAVTFGSTDIPMADVYHVIAHQLFGVGDPAGRWEFVPGCMVYPPTAADFGDGHRHGPVGSAAW